ncbi:MAG: DUF5057 domain-containing protein [Erysipelotrichales bacterium]|nr:DUF5057 domain-containing protein [Erysipelotrichales bacterium]
MKAKDKLLRRALSLVLSFSLVLPGISALVGDSGNAQAAGTKTTIRVLAIEPGDSHLLSAATVASWGYTGGVSITYVSALEFAGIKEDLSENYDLIYIGDNGGTTYGLNLDSGYLYANIGKTYKMPDNAVGLTDAEYESGYLPSPYGSYYELQYPSTNTRYSGNDLTSVQLAALNEYAVEGHPVIMADSLTNGDGRLGYSSVTFKAEITGTPGSSNIKLNAAPVATSGTLPDSVDPTYKWYRTGYSLALSTSSSYTVYSAGTYYCAITYTIHGVDYTATSDYYICTPRTAGTTISNSVSSDYGIFYGPDTSAFHFTTSTPSGPSSISPSDPSSITFNVSRSGSTIPTGTTVKYEWYLSNTGALVGSTYSSNTSVSMTIPVRLPAYGTPDIYYCEATVVLDDAGHSQLNSVTTCRSRKNIRVTRSSTNNNNVTYASPNVSPRPADGVFPVYNTFTPKATPNSGMQTSDSLSLTASSNSWVSGIDTAYQWITTVPGYAGSTANSQIVFDQSAWPNGAVYTALCYVTVTGATTSSSVKTNTLTLTRSVSTAVADPNHPGVPKSFEVSGVQYTINTSKVDNCSNMYAFLNGNKSRIDVMCPAMINTADLLNAINLSKPVISLSSYPTDYTSIGGATLAADAGSSPETYTLSFTFSISNVTDPTPEDTGYYCYLAVDSNADGAFGTDERLSDLVIKGGGTVVSSGNLLAGTVYTVSRTLPVGTFGIIPWELKIIDSGAGTARASKHGYTRIATPPGKAKVLNILQINADSGLSLDNTTNASLNGTNALNSTWATFNALFNEVAADYDINIQTVTTNAVDSIASAAITNKLIDGSPSFTSISDFLKSYDMIIMGIGGTDTNYYNLLTVGDGITDYDLSEEATGAILEYLDEKPVIFTHDTTSWTNLPEPYAETWDGDNNYYGYYPFYGYFINTTLRDRFGLDRYGVTNDTYGHTNMSEPSLSSSGLAARGYSGITDGVKTALLDGGYSIAYLPGSDKAAYVTATQGFSNYISTILHLFTTTADDVSQVNEGQITSYPYDINSGVFVRSAGADLSVADTHAQCYQVNMSSNDTTVWYCLDDIAYDYNDVSNAPYLYRRGNVTYSGFGNTVGYIYNTAEARLFVNTIIAASDSAGTSPEVKFCNASGTKAISDFLLPFNGNDILLAGSGEYGMLYFSISGGAALLSASFSFDGGTHTASANIYDSSGNNLGSSAALENNQVYHVKISDIWPLLPTAVKSALISSGTAIPLTVTVTSIGEGSLSASATVQLRKLTLFDLD